MPSTRLSSRSARASRIVPRRTGKKASGTAGRLGAKHMTIDGHVLPQSGIVLSGQQGIGPVVAIDDEVNAMAFAGACAAPATNPMIARIGNSRLSAKNNAMKSYLTGSGAEARRRVRPGDHNPITKITIRSSSAGGLVDIPYSNEPAELIPCQSYSQPCERRNIRLTRREPLSGTRARQADRAWLAAGLPWENGKCHT